MPAPTPISAPADRDDLRSHAWVPPAAALLLLLWVLATLWVGAATGRGGSVDGAGGLAADGTRAGAGVREGGATGASGTGPGASASGVATGSDASSADTAGLPGESFAPAAAPPAGVPTPAQNTAATDAVPTAAAGPVRQRRLGFSSDLLAAPPAAAAVSVPVAPPSSAAQGTVGAGGAASFFGQAGRGTRFVYVIDRSGSMNGARFDAARFEIVKSIRSLRDHESFQVVFYSNDFMVMPTPGLLRASAANKEKAVDWVRGVSPGGGTDPSGALEHALTTLRPTTIWLLSDGSFNTDVTGLLQQLNPGAEVQINTIAFHSRGGEALLKIIADENDGDYRHVGP